MPNPNWSLFGSYSFTLGGTPTPTDTATLPSPWGVTAGLGDSNALEDSLSGKRWLRLKVARAALAAARLGRADAQRTLELAVKTAYIQSVQARDNLDFALQVQTGANQIFQLNQTRYNAGAISEADLAKVETMKLEADQAVDAADRGAARRQGAAGVSARRARPRARLQGRSGSAEVLRARAARQRDRRLARSPRRSITAPI